MSIEGACVASARGAAASPTIHVVDDDAMVRTALVRLLGATGTFRVRPHACAGAFLAAYDPEEHGCLVLDMSLPGLGGIGLQDELRGRDLDVATVFLSGCADVRTCAEAMRRGAVDFLTKPADETLLLAAVSRALARDARQRTLRAHQSMVAARLATLTPREREVISHVVAGRLNKQIAGLLGTAEKTVKVHRARGMEKLRVRSVAELVRLVEGGRRPADDL